MISNRDFLVLSDAWNGLPTSTMHLFRRFLRHNRVFWFNTVNRMPRFCVEDARRVAAVVRHWAGWSGCEGTVVGPHSFASAEAPYVVSPIMIPWFKQPLRRVNLALLRRSYRRLVREHGLHNPILVTTFPSAADFVRSADCSLKIYHCVDDWLEFPGYAAADFRVMEGQLLEQVHGLAVTSRALAKKAKAGCPVLYLPHGVDFQHFAQGAKDRAPPSRLARIRRPIVGFFGLIGAWIDLALVATLARRFPEVSFVLIGETAPGLDLTGRPVQDCDNVHFLGRVPYADLPAYARGFDIGLIPYAISRHIMAVRPLKLLEYFAAGLPVLATRFPELEQVCGPIRLASTAEEFCQGLQEMLLDGPAARRREAQDIARENTWDQRAEQFSAFLENLSR